MEKNSAPRWAQLATHPGTLAFCSAKEAPPSATGGQNGGDSAPWEDSQ